MFFCRKFFIIKWFVLKIYYFHNWLKISFSKNIISVLFSKTVNHVYELVVTKLSLSPWFKILPFLYLPIVYGFKIFYLWDITLTEPLVMTPTLLFGNIILLILKYFTSPNLMYFINVSLLNLLKKLTNFNFLHISKEYLSALKKFLLGPSSVRTN